MAKIHIDLIIGQHKPGNGEGITLEDLYQLLKSLPRQVRDNYAVVRHPDGSATDLTGLGFAQSDQAEKWEFKAYVLSEDV